MRFFSQTLHMRAWRLVWKNKVLWFFGFFATLAVGEGIIELLISVANTTQSRTNDLQSVAAFFQNTGLAQVTLADILLKFSTNVQAALSFFFALGVFLAMLIFLVWLAVLSQGAVIGSVERARKEKLITFENGLISGMHHFWQLFGLVAIKKVAILLIVSIVSLLSASALSANGMSLGLFFVLLMLAIAALFSITLLVMIALVSTVQKQHTALFALRDAFSLFKKHWLAMFEVAVALFILKIVTFFVVVLLPGIGIVALGTGLVGSYVTSFSGITIISLIVLIVPLALLALFSALFTSFQLVVWTEFYETMQQSRVTSVLLRWTQRVRRTS